MKTATGKFYTEPNYSRKGRRLYNAVTETRDIEVLKTGYGIVKSGRYTDHNDREMQEYFLIELTTGSVLAAGHKSVINKFSHTVTLDKINVESHVVRYNGAVPIERDLETYHFRVNGLKFTHIIRSVLRYTIAGNDEQ